MSSKQTEATEETTSLQKAGPSSIDPPPTFEESAGHLVVEFDETFSPPGGEIAPPGFAAYEAEHFVDGTRGIVSHDNHLNTDGEALYRFLLGQAATYPDFLLKVKGTHSETHTRLVSRQDNQGHTHTRTERYTETVTDFDFRIDVGQHIISGPVHWSVGDSEPVYRGAMIRQESDGMGGVQKATKESRKAYKEWVKERTARGLPPWCGGWVDVANTGEPIILKSTRTLRQWADDYCASRKYLKEFKYEKVIHGWNIQALESAVLNTISNTNYRGACEVSFTPQSAQICIRSDNRLSRTLSNKWLKFLLWILFIYPFIWLFKRFHSRGGGRWEVCGGAYTFKAWERQPEIDTFKQRELKHTQDPWSDTLASPPDASSSSSRPAYESTDSRPRYGGDPNRPSNLVGLREGEWFQRWENVIRMSVLNRVHDQNPMTMPMTNVNHNAMMLDGYTGSD